LSLSFEKVKRQKKKESQYQLISIPFLNSGAEFGRFLT